MLHTLPIIPKNKRNKQQQQEPIEKNGLLRSFPANLSFVLNRRNKKGVRLIVRAKREGGETGFPLVRITLSMTFVIASPKFKKALSLHLF